MSAACRSILAPMLWVAAVSSAAAAPLQTAETVSRVRKALGYDQMAKAPAIEIRGTADDSGITGAFRFTYEPNGHYFCTVGGLLGGEGGFDGSTCWACDRPRATRRLECSIRERALLDAWLLSGYWLKGPLEIDLLDSDPGKQIVLAIRLKGGRLHGTLTIDPLTFLPARLRLETGPLAETWTYLDYRLVLGGKLPHRIVHEALGSADTIAITDVRAARYDPALFRFKSRPADNVHFDPAKAAAVPARRTRTGHLVVRPLIDGKDVGWFLLDTGAAGIVIDRAVAQRLELPAVGATPLRGVGGTVQTRYRQARSFRLGRMTLIDPTMLEFDLQSAPALVGEPVAGLAGFPVFESAVVEVDVSQPAVALYDPAHYDGQAISWRELVLDGYLPCVRGRFEGNREGLFTLDTGMASNVCFNARAIKELALLSGRQTAAGTSAGVGGDARNRQGTIDWFELAGQRFEKPRAAFDLDAAGGYLEQDTLGDLGQGFLKPFRVVFWYREKKIAFLK